MSSSLVRTSISLLGQFLETSLVAMLFQSISKQSGNEVDSFRFLALSNLGTNCVPNLMTQLGYSWIVCCVLLRKHIELCTLQWDKLLANSITDIHRHSVKLAFNSNADIWLPFIQWAHSYYWSQRLIHFEQWKHSYGHLLRSCLLW